MSRAIRIRGFGGPEVLCLEDVDVGPPGPGQVRLAHDAIGLNMVDTYYRTGLYPLDLPSGLGSEGAGVVAEIGSGVTGLEVGDRIAYASPAPLDGYSEERLIDARWLVRVPEAVGSEIAAAMMLKGLTAWFLLKRSFRVGAGDWIVLYAAAGGVGLITSQWASRIGARVIGIVGSQAKAAIAREHGCEAVVLAHDDVVGRVRELTGGRGAAAVYDSIGKDTFMQSLDCLRPHGVMVTFGNASGPVPPFAPLELSRRGSLYVTRPTLFDFIRERETLEVAAAELNAVVADGTVRIEIGQRYALADAAQAQRDLEGRRTMGSTILLP
jgi:NADPH:quinone reductase